VTLTITRVLAALAMALIAEVAAATQPLTSLSELRWSNRVILVGENDQRTIEQLVEHRAALEERDVIWIAVGDAPVQSNSALGTAPALIDALQNDYFGRFDETVFLIGKDGTLKLRQADLDLPALFERIDAMPMRQREMRQSATP
jgi:hypothetical protein